MINKLYRVLFLGIICLIICQIGEAQQIRQKEFRAASLVFDPSLGQLLTYGTFSSEGFSVDGKTYSIDLATFEFSVYGEGDLTMDQSPYLGKDYERAKGLISIKEVDNRIYEPEFLDTLYDENKDLLYFPFVDEKGLLVYQVDPDRLTLQHLTTLNQAPTYGRPRYFNYLGKGLNFAYAVNDRIIIVQECATPSSPPDFNKPDLLIQCGFPDTVKIFPPTGYSQVFFNDYISRNETHYNKESEVLAITRSGTYEVSVADEEGCLSAAKVFRVEQSYKPNAPHLIGLGQSGSFSQDTIMSQCKGAFTLLSTSFQDDREDLFYVWSTGDTARQINAREPGVYWVEAHTMEGCVSDKSNTITIRTIDKQIPPPPMIIGVDGNLNRCGPSQTVVQLRPSGDYKAFHWGYLGLSSFRPILDVLNTDRQTVYLRGLSREGCWSEYRIHRIEHYINPGRAPEVISLEGQLISSKHGKAYEWYLEEVLLPNVNQMVLIPSRAGNYQVRVFNGNCWTPLSQKLYVP